METPEVLSRVAPQGEPKGRCAQRQKQEAKELSAQVSALMKRGGPKRELKRVRAEWERALAAKHEAELARYTRDEADEPIRLYEQVEPTDKQRRANERYRAERAPPALTHDYGADERQALAELLGREGLAIHDIAPDGHCLFAAVSHQAALAGIACPDARELRRAVAEYEGAHRDEYEPLVTAETGMPFAAYTEELAQTRWGGEVELSALAAMLGVRIAVYCADGRVLAYGDGPLLRLAFHARLLAAGGHYSSVVPL